VVAHAAVSDVKRVICPHSRLPSLTDLLGNRQSLVCWRDFQSWFLDSPIADVETSTLLAAVHDQVITSTDSARCLIPEFQGDAVSLSNAAALVEGLAAA
jgi:hypothetical protein